MRNDHTCACRLCWRRCWRRFIGRSGRWPSPTAQKIVCWKDKSGKTVGCGDKVPPEYQDSATRELDKRGVTRKTTETRRGAGQARGPGEGSRRRQKAEEKKRLAEQKRQDSALLNTYTNEKEIDLRRDRDLQVVDSQITQLQVLHKNATDRHNEVKGAHRCGREGRKARVGRPEGRARARRGRHSARLEQSIAGKEKEKEEIRKRYADMKARYIELRGGTPPRQPAAPAAPAKK